MGSTRPNATRLLAGKTLDAFVAAEADAGHLRRHRHLLVYETMAFAGTAFAAKEASTS
jgi:hypothetical protein